MQKAEAHWPFLLWLRQDAPIPARHFEKDLRDAGAERELRMTLVIDNPTVELVLKPADINAALEMAALELATGGAVNAPPYRVLTPRNSDEYRDHPRFPKGGGDPTHHSFTSLTGAIAKLDVTSDRVDSDIITYFQQDGRVLQRRVPGRAGAFCGLIYLYSSRTGELLAIIHDGYLQKFRVAGTGAVGAKYLAREDARVMALIGTGWQAEGAAHCFAALGALKRIKVYSPTPGKKEAFANKVSEEAQVEIVPVQSAREAVRGADIVYMATNSKDPVVMADWLEPGQYVSNVSDVELELAGWERCDVLVMNRHGRRWMRYAIGGEDVIPEHARDQYTRPTRINWDQLPLLGEVISGTHPGRTAQDQITGLVLRGDGVQFTAVGHLIYERCKQQGLGHEIPSNLFLQDERYIP
jgi:ornithine cyclodeaminase/alanine dehydrogenase-like protein (mu-crystallin family)